MRAVMGIDAAWTAAQPERPCIRGDRPEPARLLRILAALRRRIGVSWRMPREA